MTIAETVTAADGTFLFLDVGLISGDVVLLSADDGAGSINANTVFIDWEPLASPVADVFLYENTLAVQSRGTGVVTEEDLRIADLSPGSTLFSVTGDLAVDALTIESGASLFIPYGAELLMAGGAQLQPRGDFYVNGTFRASGAGVDAGGSIFVGSGGIFDAGTGATFVGGDLLATGLMENPGAVVFDGARSSAFNPGANEFTDIAVFKTDGAAVTLTGSTLTVQNLSVIEGGLELQESATLGTANVEAFGSLSASAAGKTYSFGSPGSPAGQHVLQVNGGAVRFRGPGSQLRFQPGAAVDVSAGATFEISGDAGQEIVAASADPLASDPWLMGVDATSSLSVRSAQISNSRASGFAVPLTAYDSIDGGNNTDWLFSAFPALVADAGTNLSVHVGTGATLDGSGSTSLSSYPLSYSWSILSAPAGSTATLSGADTVQPVITPDMTGEYQFELIVIDQITLDASMPATVTLTATNNPPIARGGGDQTMPRNITVTLDGSGSSDSDEDSLSYLWSLSVPAGSAAALSDPTAMNPSFVVDLAGDYLATLTVHDGYAASAPDTVTVSTFNAAPVADAGDDQVIMDVGSVVELNGTTSYDDDGDAMTYAWSIESAPVGSYATLSDPSVPNPTFIADINGEYVVQLTVTDEFGAKSNPDSVTVSFDNVAPVARITAEKTTVVAGDAVSLDASTSHDANGDPLTVSWSLISRPADSQASLSSAGAPSTHLSTDMIGEYVVSLIVRDDITSSEPATVMVVSVGTLSTAVMSLMKLSDEIDNLNCGVFINCAMKKTLSNKLGMVAMKIQDGDFATAYKKLVIDFEPKMNGCGSDLWAADKNDWIRECATGQDIVRPKLTLLIDSLAALLQ